MHNISGKPAPGLLELRDHAPRLAQIGLVLRRARPKRLELAGVGGRALPGRVPHWPARGVRRDRSLCSSGVPVPVPSRFLLEARF